MTDSYINHLWIANGSLAELETHLLIAERFGIAERLGYVGEDDLVPVLDLIRQVGRMRIALRRSLQSRTT